jgi:hypothetical protein
MADETKTYIIDIQSNYQQYIDDLKAARDELEKQQVAQLKLTEEQKKDADFMEKFNAKLRNLKQEVRDNTKIVDQATKANKAQNGSYEQLYRTWQVAQTKLKLMGDGMVKSADGTYKLTQAYIDQSKAVEQAKRGLDAFGKGIADNRLNVGNYSEAIQGALGGIGTKLTGLLAPATLVTGAIALAGKVFQGLKDAVMSTTFAIDIMNKSIAVSKQLFYDVAINGELNIKNLREASKIQGELNALRVKDSFERLEISKINREEQEIRELSIDRTKTHAERLEYLNKVIDLENQKTKIKIGNLTDELNAQQKLLKLQPANEKLLINIIELKAQINDTYAEEEVAMRRVNAQRTAYIQEEIDARKKLFDDYYKFLEERNAKADKEVKDAAQREVDEQVAGQKHWKQQYDQVSKEGMLIKTKEANHRGFFDIFKSLQEKTVEVLKDTNKQAAESDTKLATLKINNQEAVTESITSSLNSFSILIGQQTEAGKAFAIAAATIDTYAAAAKALNDPTIPSTWARIATMATVIIRGLANVKQIMSVKVGSSSGSMSSAPAAITSAPSVQRMYATPSGASIMSQPQLSQSQLNALPNQNLLTAEDIAKAIAALPNPVVSIEDINARTASVRKVAVRANI